MGCSGMPLLECLAVSLYTADTTRILLGYSWRYGPVETALELREERDHGH